MPKKIIEELMRKRKPPKEAVAIAVDVEKKDVPEKKEDSVESILDFLMKGGKEPMPKKKEEDEDELALLLKEFE